jgi:maltose alpha-D-glucosyltransferase/alpha-amylase
VHGDGVVYSAPAIVAASSPDAQDGLNPTVQPASAVAPAPLDAQPGEAAAPPRSAAPMPAASASQRRQPRESPSAGDPVPAGGRLDARASSALADAHASHHLSSRVGTAEQSNTSILYGRQFILKLFRRLQPGENPDVEIGRFLTEIAHFPHIAPFLGEISITPAGGEKTTVAMLQGLVSNQGDGWEWFLGQVGEIFAQLAAVLAPSGLARPAFGRKPEPLPDAMKTALPSLEAAALLGRRTAEMHLALSTPTDNPAFAAEPFTAADLSRDADRIEVQLRASFEALRTQLPNLDESTSDAAALLLSRRLELISRARALAASSAAGQRIRIHGDYHLGQTLRTEDKGDAATDGKGDFVLLDFEGEPARALVERRRKHSPLKDVAGMMRSFSYAAYSALQHLSSEASGSLDNLWAWARLWQNAASARFLESYSLAIAASPELLPPPPQAQNLLDAYLLEKALYELLYELNNRPSWLHIPISGILSL